MNQGTSQQFTATGTFSLGGVQNVSALVVGGGSAPSFANQTSCVGAGTSVACPALATTTGQAIVVYERAGSAVTLGTPTDTQGDTFTAAMAQLTFGSSANRSGRVYYSLNVTGNAANAVTCNSASATITCLYRIYSGIATSAAVDGTPTAVANAFSNSCTSTGVTTANATDALILFCDDATSGLTFSAPTGYGNLFGDASGVAAGTDQITSATGTYSPVATYSGAGHQNGTFFLALEGASSTTGWTATDLSGSQVATVNGSGLVQGNNIGTSTIKAAIGAVNGTVVVTVQTSTGGTVTISPANPQASPGKTVQFTASQGGQTLSGCTWSSSNNSFATIGASSGLATAVAVGQVTITASCP
jgi:hypothetical protein